jgi:hypothetical protein
LSLNWRYNGGWCTPSAQPVEAAWIEDTEAADLHTHGTESVASTTSADSAIGAGRCIDQQISSRFVMTLRVFFVAASAQIRMATDMGHLDDGRDAPLGPPPRIPQVPNTGNLPVPPGRRGHPHRRLAPRHPFLLRGRRVGPGRSARSGRAGLPRRRRIRRSEHLHN